jgi:peptidylprolyl isomerase
MKARVNQALGLLPCTARVCLVTLAVFVNIGIAHGAQIGSDDGNTVLIHTDAGDVTMGEARANLAALPPQSQGALIRDHAALSNMVRLIAAQKLALKEALDKGWDKQPEVATAIDRARANIVLQSYISTSTQPPKDYPSDSELDAAYDANRTKFTVPRKFRYAQIVIALPRDANAATRGKAEVKLANVQQKLKARGADFGAISASLSDDPESASRQGEVEAVGEAKIPPGLKQCLTAMKAGEISGPVRDDKGWTIVKLLQVSEARLRPLSEVRTQMRAELRSMRGQENAKARIDGFVKIVPAPSEDALTHLTGQPAP